MKAKASNTNNSQINAATSGSLPAKGYIKQLALLLFGLSVLLYANTFGNGYVLDDKPAITQNKIVQQGVSGIPVLLKTGFLYGMYGMNSSKASYRPVSLISFAIENTLWGNNPHVSHIVQVLLFALTVVLIFYILSQLSGVNIAFAFIIAALYAAHPIHTEVVANLKSRDEIFGFLFVLLSMLFAFRYLKTNRIPALGLSALFFFSAMMSKENEIAFLVIIPLTLYFFKTASKSQLINCIIGLTVATASYIFLRISLFGDLIHTDTSFVSLFNIMQPAGFIGRLPTAIAIMGRYIGLLFFPHPLSFDYSFKMIELHKWTNIEFIISFCICLGLLGYAAFSFMKKNIISYSILFFFISMFIISNIPFVIGAIMGERFLYAPSLGFCIAIGSLLMLLYKKGENTNIFPLSGQPVLLVSLGVLLALYGFKTVSRNGEWKDEMTLYSSDIKHSAKSAPINFLLGNALLETVKGKENAPESKETINRAEGYLNTAVEIYPQYVDALNCLANLEQTLGNYDKAKEYMNKMIGVSHEMQGLNEGGSMNYNKGNILLANKDYAGAVSEYKKCIAANPKMAEAYINMGNTYFNMNYNDSAITALTTGLRLNPNIQETYIDLGSCYIKSNEFPKAIESYKTAQKMNPKDVKPYLGMANAYGLNNQLDLALENILKCLELNPDYMEGHFRAGTFYVQKKQFKDAIIYFKKAHELNPQYIEAIINLGYCYMQVKDYTSSIDYYMQSLQINPKDAQVCATLAYLYQQTGNKAKMMEFKKRSDELQGH